MAEHEAGAPTRGRATEPPPPRGVPIEEADGVFRVVAGNPGPMTYHGTNTWFVRGEDERLTVVDPGPEDPAHLEAVLRAGNGRIGTILVSHWHQDHLGNAAALARALDLPLHGHALLAERVDAPLLAIGDGDRAGGLVALHTPGHAQDHLCFARADGLLFTADHVMGWSTSVVPPPPHGDAGDYVRSLQRLLDRDDGMYLPGHGPTVARPRTLVAALLSQRQRREREILRAVSEGHDTVTSLRACLYPTLKTGLDFAARANIEGFLALLAAKGALAADGDNWHLTAPARAQRG